MIRLALAGCLTGRRCDDQRHWVETGGSLLTVVAALERRAVGGSGGGPMGGAGTGGGGGTAPDGCPGGVP
jgi:hypothetical protein